jgi:hypothetical protein
MCTYYWSSKVLISRSQSPNVGLVSGLYVILTDCLPARSDIAFPAKYWPFMCPNFCDKADMLTYFLSNVVIERPVVICLESFMVVFWILRPGIVRNLRFISGTWTLKL